MHALLTLNESTVEIFIFIRFYGTFFCSESPSPLCSPPGLFAPTLTHSSPLEHVIQGRLEVGVGTARYMPEWASCNNNNNFYIVYWLTSGLTPQARRGKAQCFLPAVNCRPQNMRQTADPYNVEQPLCMQTRLLPAISSPKTSACNEGPTRDEPRAPSASTCRTFAP